MTKNGGRDEKASPRSVLMRRRVSGQRGRVSSLWRWEGVALYGGARSHRIQFKFAGVGPPCATAASAAQPAQSRHVHHRQLVLEVVGLADRSLGGVSQLVLKAVHLGGRSRGGAHRGCRTGGGSRRALLRRPREGLAGALGRLRGASHLRSYRLHACRATRTCAGGGVLRATRTCAGGG